MEGPPKEAYLFDKLKTKQRRKTQTKKLKLTKQKLPKGIIEKTMKLLWQK